MPPVRIDGKVTRIAGILAGPIEGVGTNMVSSFAWAHLRAHNSPEAVLQAMHRPVLYSHYVNLGFGTVLAPRVVVGDNGYPSVIAHLYTISLSGAEWSYGVADVDNYTIRNIVLRIVAQVAGATQRAHPVGNDVAYHVSKLWDRLRIEYERPPQAASRGVFDSQAGNDLDTEFCRAGFLRRCALNFDLIVDDGDRPLNVNIFATLLQGLPSAELRAEIADAYVGRQITLGLGMCIGHGYGDGGLLVERLLLELRALPADWQRAELLRQMHSHPTTAQFVPDMFATRHPLPSVLVPFRGRDPCQRHDPRPTRGISNLTSNLHALGLGVLRSSPGAANQFGVVTMLLEQLRDRINTSASASMPPRLFATRNWTAWFDQYGTAAIRKT
jgi:hypothetical protein